MTLFLCHINDITDPGSKGFESDEGAFFAVRKNNQIFVYVNSCPHNRLPLDWQPDQFLDCEKIFIQCASHGALFKIENGECVSGPCLTQYLKTVPHSLIDDKIYIDPPPLA